MTKLQILALLLASIALLFFTSCDNDNFQEPGVYKVTLICAPGSTRV